MELGGTLHQLQGSLIKEISERVTSVGESHVPRPSLLLHWRIFFYKAQRTLQRESVQF